MSELVALLGAADAKLAGTAQDAVGRLRDPRSCTGLDEAETLPTDPVGRVVVEQARTLLDRAAALQYAAKLAEADALAARVIAMTDSPRLVGEALLVRARVSIDRAQHDRAEDQLFEAMHAAQRGRDDRAVAEIWVEIVMTTGAQKHRFDLALSNARAADAALARIEPGDLQLRYAYTLGAMLLAQGKLDDARTRLNHGLSLAKRDHDPRRKAQLGLYQQALCDVERQAGNLRPAREHCKQALALLEQTFGPDHMRVALTLNVSGALAFAEHDLATAERSYKRVIEILDHLEQADQITYALALSNLGAVYSSRDDITQARTFFERALAKFDAHYPKHPQRLLPLQGLASLALRTGDTAAAVERYLQVRDSMAAAYPANHPQLLIATYNLALAYVGHKQPANAQAALDELIARATTPGKESWMLAARGYDLAATIADEGKQRRQALALIDKALAAIERANDPVERALVLRHQGEIYRHLKQPALAIAPLERALRDFGSDPDAYDIGTTRYHLAAALIESGGNKARAIEVAKQAAADLAKARTGEALQAYRDQLAKLLALHE
jgi:tetratricopeptide (TPR) repeat protein